MDAVMQRLAEGRNKQLEELKEFLAYPSVSTDPARRGEVRDCAGHLLSRMEQAGLADCRLHETPGHPVLTGRWGEDPARPTLLIYGHYDVQPEDPLELWDSPPFEARVRDGRIYARGAADDKGQLYAHLKAVQAFLETRGELPLNLVFIFEGEEEVGSPSLEGFLAEHRGELEADCALISDTSMFARGRPSITYGLKGLCYMELDLEGPNRDLHSGSFGGPVLNPLNVMAELLASLKDDQGRIVVEGFYDKVLELSEAERRAFAELEFDEQAFARDLAVEALQPERGWSVLEHLWGRPTCDVNGLSGGFAGEGAKTVLPARVNAKFSFRLVPDQDPDEIADLVEAHLKARLPRGIRARFTRHHSGLPAIIPIDHPAVRAGMRALERGFETKPVYQREGGSIPIVAAFDSLLGLKTVLMGFGLPDGNVHSPNENLDLECFYRGMQSAAWFYELLPRELERGSE